VQAAALASLAEPVLLPAALLVLELVTALPADRVLQV